MKFLTFLFLSLTLVGCVSEPPLKKSGTRTDVKLVNEISNKVAKKLKEQYGLIPCGTGSQMMDKIKMIALSFDYYAVIDQEKARTLLLAAVNELVAAVNQEEKIRPYLNNSPFGPNDVEIMIFLYKKDRSNHSPENLAVVTSIGGVLAYKIDDPKKNILFTTVLTESYEEAVKKQALGNQLQTCLK